jgi:hypothetical protein
VTKTTKTKTANSNARKAKIAKKARAAAEREERREKAAYHTYNMGSTVPVPKFLSEMTIELIKKMISEGLSLQQVKDSLSRHDYAVTEAYQHVVEERARDEADRKRGVTPLDFNQLSLIDLCYTTGRTLDYILETVKHAETQRQLVINAFTKRAEGISIVKDVKAEIPFPDPVIVVQQMADSDRLTGARHQFDFLLDEIKNVKSGQRAKADSYDLVTKAAALFAELIA